jgi:hypothetical protein
VSGWSRCVSRSATAAGLTEHFDAVFESCGLRILKSPPQAPRANALCERLIGTPRRGDLDKILILNEAHLRAVSTEYVTHYKPRSPTRASPSTSPTTTRNTPPRTSSTCRPPGSGEDRSSEVSPANMKSLHSHSSHRCGRTAAATRGRSARVSSACGRGLRGTVRRGGGSGERSSHPARLDRPGSAYWKTSNSESCAAGQPVLAVKLSFTNRAVPAGNVIVTVLPVDGLKVYPAEPTSVE